MGGGGGRGGVGRGGWSYILCRSYGFDADQVGRELADAERAFDEESAKGGIGGSCRSGLRVDG